MFGNNNFGFNGGGGSGGSGGSQNLQQTTDIGNTTTDNIIFNDEVPTPPASTTVTKNYFTVLPLSEQDTTPPFLFGISSTGGDVPNGGATNHVMYMGWNLEPGGGVQQPGYPAIGEGWENRWRPDSDIDYTEKHEVYGNTAGELFRISSYTINNVNSNITLYHTVDTFDLRNHVRKTPYWSAFGVDNSTGISLINSADQSTYFNIVANFAADVDRASYSITAGTGKALNEFVLAGFTNVAFPKSLNLIDTAANATAILFSGVMGDMGQITVNSNGIEFTTLIDKPIDFSPNNITSFRTTSTHNISAVPLYITNDITLPAPTQWMLIDNPDRAVTARFNNTRGTGTNYGFQSIITGGADNIGGYIFAINGTSNKCLVLSVTPAGANNWSLYNDSEAQSYFAGSVGIGIDTPVASALLQLESTTKGFRPPKMTTTQRDAISSPAEGLVIYNSSTKKINLYTTAWEQVTSI